MSKTMLVLTLLVVWMAFVVHTALAQGGDWTKQIPQDPIFFLYLLFIIAFMVGHWAFKKFVRKDPVADFVTYFILNTRWTFAALGVGAMMLTGEWSILNPMPWTMPAKWIMILTAGWTADSALNGASTSFGSRALLTAPDASSQGKS